jgi:hypothetical protein
MRISVTCMDLSCLQGTSVLLKPAFSAAACVTQRDDAHVAVADSRCGGLVAADESTWHMQSEAPCLCHPLRSRSLRVATGRVRSSPCDYVPILCCSRTPCQLFHDQTLRLTTCFCAAAPPSDTPQALWKQANNLSASLRSSRARQEVVHSLGVLPESQDEHTLEAVTVTTLADHTNLTAEQVNNFHAESNTSSIAGVNIVDMQTRLPASLDASASVSQRGAAADSPMHSSAVDSPTCEGGHSVGHVLRHLFVVDGLKAKAVPSSSSSNGRGLGDELPDVALTCPPHGSLPHISNTDQVATGTQLGNEQKLTVSSSTARAVTFPLPSSGELHAAAPRQDMNLSSELSCLIELVQTVDSRVSVLIARILQRRQRQQQQQEEPQVQQRRNSLELLPPPLQQEQQQQEEPWQDSPQLLLAPLTQEQEE